jgi:hypothetical protein
MSKSKKLRTGGAGAFGADRTKALGMKPGERNQQSDVRVYRTISPENVPSRSMLGELQRVLAESPGEALSLAEIEKRFYARPKVQAKVEKETAKRQALPESDKNHLGPDETYEYNIEHELRLMGRPRFQIVNRMRIVITQEGKGNDRRVASAMYETWNTAKTKWADKV